MSNLLEQMREIKTDTLLTKVFAYGYLDQLVQDYALGNIDNQQLRKQHYMLQCAVEARLLEIERVSSRLAREAMMVGRARGRADRPTEITER